MRRSAIGVVAALALALAGSAAGAAPGVYATVSGSKKAGVAQFDIRAGGLLARKRPGKVGPGNQLSGITLTPDGRTAYVGLNSTNPAPGPTTLLRSLLQYSVDPKTGALARKTPFKVRSGLAPTAVVVTPNGHFAYAANSAPNTISQYRVGKKDVLRPLRPASVPTGQAPLDVAVSPNGRHLYAANANENSFAITQYDILSSGKLRPLAQPTADADQPSNIAFTPNGLSAYAAVLAGVEQYDVNPATGALTPKTPAILPLGIAPFGVAVTPNGKNAYVGSEAGINQFSIDPATGKLTPKTPELVPLPNHPIGSVSDLQVSPSGLSLYAAASCCTSVFQFNIAVSSGQISSKVPASVNSYDTPGVVAVTPDNPTARFSVRKRGLTVRVDGRKSYDSGTRMTLFSWSFGDGSHTAGRRAGHRYKHPGRYKVTLKVESRYGCRAGKLIATGHVVLCTGAHARVTHTVVVRR